MKQRLIRFEAEDDQRLEELATKHGATPQMFIRRLVLRTLEGEGSGLVIRDELQVANDRNEKQLAEFKTEIKAFLLEALVGLGERIAHSQQDFLQELGDQLAKHQNATSDYANGT